MTQANELTEAVNSIHQTWSTGVFEGEKNFPLEIPKGAYISSAKIEVIGSEAPLPEEAPSPKFGTMITPSASNANGSWVSESQTWLVLKFPTRRFVDKITIELGSECYVSLKFWAGITWFQPEPGSEYIFDTAQKEWAFPRIETDRILLSFHNKDPNENTPITTWLELDKLAVQSTKVNSLCIHCVSLPSNISLAVGDQPPFWTRLESLGKTVSTPDFAERLNEYLNRDELAVNETEHQVPVVVHSDTMGSIKLELALYYFFITDQFLDGSRDKTLDFSCGGDWMQQVRIKLPKGAMVRKATMELSGTFSKGRFLGKYGPATNETAYHAVTISPSYLPTRQFVLGQDVDLMGIDLCLSRVSPTARITVQIRLAKEQGPSEDALSAYEILLDKSFGEEAQWLCFDLPSVLHLTRGEYWLVLKAEEGEARWWASKGNGESEPLSYSKDSGKRWERYELGLSGLLRLRCYPPSYELPVVIDLAGGDAVEMGAFEGLEELKGTLDITGAVGRLALKKLDGLVTLEVQGNATGSLTISNLRIEYARVSVPIPSLPLGLQISRPLRSD